MESCFPPLAGFSLRSNSNNTKSNKNRHSIDGVGGVIAATGGKNPSSSSSSSIMQSNSNTNYNHRLNHHYYIQDDGYQDQQNEFKPKIDVLQDLDLFYIRQIASSLKELDLEQKIDLEIKMREGSAKLLAACNNNAKHTTKTIGFSGNSTLPHNTQILEAAKNLLTSNERMTAYMAELQKRKRDRDSLHSISTQQTKNSQTSTTTTTNPTTKSTTTQSKPTGKLSLNEIRMPLMWRDTDHFKNKGDHRRFAVFCLAKIGTEIYDTSLLCPIDRNSTDISFHDAILFTNITPDFELKLEVYAVMMESDLTIASTPRKIKNTIHSSISRTVGKRLAANLKDELHNTKIGPKYDLIATATLKLPDASNLPHTHDLTTATNTINNNSSGGVILTSGNSGTLNSTTTNASCKLPLFGHFCCRLAVQPDAITVSQCIGSNLSLTIGTEAIVDTGGGGGGAVAVQPRQRNSSRGKPAIVVPLPTIDSQITLIPIGGYGKLQAFQLQLWTSENLAIEELPPTVTLDITRDTKLKHLDEFSILICNMEEGKMKQYILSTNSLTESAKWYTALKRTIKEHLQWEHLTLEPCMELATPGNTKQYYLRSSSTLGSTLSSSSSTRFASLYDQVPILEHNIDVRPPATNRPSVHDIFSIQNHNSGNGNEPSSTTPTTIITTTTIINNESSSPTLGDYRTRTNSSSASSAERCSSSQSSSTLSGSSIGSINSRKNYNWTTEKAGSSTTSSTSSSSSSSSGSGGSKNNIKNGK